jgi:hypothetical protein
VRSHVTPRPRKVFSIVRCVPVALREPALPRASSAGVEITSWVPVADV